MSSATGGRADKLGNRYEGWWVALKLIELLAEEVRSVQLEALGETTEILAMIDASAPGGWIGEAEFTNAEWMLLFATDGSGRGLIPELDEALWPARGQVLATEPLGERLFGCPHYARQGFDYWQQLPDLRIVLGGFRDFSILTEMTDDETTTEPIQEVLDAFLVELLGELPEVTHRWAGIFGLTQDLLPLAGPVPGHEGVWVAAGYSGHGNVFGLLCGELVAGALLGRDDPLLQLFAPARIVQHV